MNSLIGRLSASWRQASRVDRNLARVLGSLEAAHRQLVDLASGLPPAARAPRDHAEALQSALVEAEAEAARSCAAAHARYTLATRQLAATQELLRQAQGQRVERFDCFRGQFLLQVLAAAGAAFLALFECMALDQVGLVGKLALGQAVLAFWVVGSHATRFAFDGRWLRVSNRFLGRECGKPWFADLAGREVHIATEQLGDEENPHQIATVVVRPLGHGSDEVRVCVSANVSESKRLASQLAAWCSLAR